MTREILFRGKIKDGFFVFGFYVTDGIGHFISYYDKGLKRVFDTKVIPESVGQFTGLTDKNGVKIFEHDIVQARNYNYDIPISTQEPFIDTFIISFNNFMWKAKSESSIFALSVLKDRDVEVIGNIHEVNHD